MMFNRLAENSLFTTCASTQVSMLATGSCTARQSLADNTVKSTSARIQIVRNRKVD